MNVGGRVANEQNLRPAEHKFTLEEAKRGAKASAESRRRKKALRECLEILLEREYQTASGETVTGADRISARLFKNALEGDNKAFEIIRDTVGQQPVQRVEVDTIDPQARAEMDELLGLNE